MYCSHLSFHLRSLLFLVLSYRMSGLRVGAQVFEQLTVQPLQDAVSNIVEHKTALLELAARAAVLLSEGYNIRGSEWKCVDDLLIFQESRHQNIQRKGRPKPHRKNVKWLCLYWEMHSLSVYQYRACCLI